jgi:RHS repeat-associated protein
MPNNPQASNPFPGVANLQSQQSLSGSCSDSTSVQLSIGNLMKTVSLVSVATVGPLLDFALYYSPQAGGWSHNYQQSVTIYWEEIVVIPPLPMLPYSYWQITGATYTAAGGRQFSYDAGFGLEATSAFTTATLALTGTGCSLTWPDGTVYAFTGSVGNSVSGPSQVTVPFTQITDPYGNSLALTYTSGKLTSIAEPTGRQITLGYTGSLVTSVEDPNSNVTTLSWDSYNNLLSVMGPDGCTNTYSYATPLYGLLTSSTDGNGYTYTFTYNGNQLVTATAPDGATITYTYDTVTEASSDYDGTVLCFRTRLLDARGNTWEYRFDGAYNLWRVIDPLGHNTHHYWDGNQRLLYSTGPFSPDGYNGYRDSSNNRFSRAAYDTSGNQLMSVDSRGQMTQMTYNAQNRVTSVVPNRAHLGVQGNWSAQFGQQGSLFFGFNGGTDLSNLPAYVSSVTEPAASVAGGSYSLIDPKVPVTSDSSWVRGCGYQKSTSGPLSLTVNLSSTVEFNLSIYTNNAYLGLSGASPVEYAEQTGDNLTLTVTDAVGTQTFQVWNNAPGVWVTFPVQGNSSTPITISAAQAGDDVSGVYLAALAFDAYDSQTTSYTYNAQGDPLTRTDPLGGVTTWTYNANGTLATMEDENSNTTQYFYEDTALNLTRVIDAAGNTWHMSYDDNGNLLTLESPDSQTWTYTYDGKNRLLTATDPLSHETQWAYDSAGNLTSTTDPNSLLTERFYTASNRLSKVVDPASGQTLFTFDGSGNLLSGTDPNGHVTQFQWDKDERMTQTTQADGTWVQYAYDGLDQLRAITTPNGTQSNPSLVNLVGANNWVSNPGIETVANNSTSAPQNWTPSGINPTGDIRDTTVSHSGAASLKLTVNANTDYWMQGPANLRAGEQALARVWILGNGTHSGVTSWMALQSYNQAGTLAEVDSAPTTNPDTGGSWLQTAWAAFSVPSDGQYAPSPVGQVRLYSDSPFTSPTLTPGSVSTWFDDVELYTVSASLGVDTVGNQTSVTLPDGTASQTVYDRFSRPLASIDPNGNVVQMAYNGKNQVVSVTDALGNVTQFQYDAVGNLTYVTDALSNVTQYTYDALNRLSSIVYPDTTTELFTYTTFGSLYTYTNNRSQSRTFYYDNAHRLTSMEYNTDSTSVSWAYDAASNVLTRTERNGDILTFEYDNLYRVINVVRAVASGSANAPWTQSQTFDPVGNRTSLTVSGGLAEYGVAEYGSSDYALSPVAWSVPSGGYDAMDRLVAVNDTDADAAALAMTYDVEGRRTSVTFPAGAPRLSTSASYDMVGRLLSLTTLAGATLVYPWSSRYDAASNRLAALSGNDHADYSLDAKNQLVSEVLNRFAERSYEAFQNGTLVGLSTDPTSNGLNLLPLSDTFSGNLLNADRWRLAYTPGNYVGLGIRQENALQFVFPLGQSNLIAFAVPSVYQAVGYLATALYAAAEHRVQMTGNFDVQVDFGTFQATGTVLGALMVSDQSVELTEATPANAAWIGRSTSAYTSQVYVAGSSVSTGSTGTSATSGQFRITRSGSTLTTYYWNGSSWVSQASSSSFSTGALWVSLILNVAANSLGTVGFTDYQVNSASFPSSATYTSVAYDAGQSVTWDALTWEATVPAGNTLSFQVAVSNSETGPFTYVGPDGTSGTYFTSSGTTLPTLTGRYASYQATFAYSSGSPASIQRVDFSYGGTNASAVTSYSMDAVGNIVGRVAEVAGSATVTETRTVNALNQITANSVVVTGGGTTNWTYAWDDSGNLTSRSDGTHTTTYQWDEDNRLTLVTLPSSATVAYTYDVAGRMLTRTDSTGTTYFTWDGWTMVAELAPNGTQTRYYAPNGELSYFEVETATTDQPAVYGSAYYGQNYYGPLVYQIVGDGVGSVRRIMDAYNNIVSVIDTDAYGNLLASTSDPLAFPYRFVGAYGVRWDAGTGLYYMRNRWYDPTLQRFISRDVVGADSRRYLYGSNNPLSWVDLSGNQPTPLTPSQTRVLGNLFQQMKDIENALRSGKLNTCHSDCQKYLPMVLAKLDWLQHRHRIVIDDDGIAKFEAQTGNSMSLAQSVQSPSSGSQYIRLRSSDFNNSLAMLEATLFHEGIHVAAGGNERAAYHLEKLFALCLQQYLDQKDTGSIYSGMVVAHAIDAGNVAQYANSQATDPTVSEPSAGFDKKPLYNKDWNYK